MKSATIYGSLLLGLLLVILVVLRATEMINWPWWLVTLPLWGGITILFFAITIEAIAMYLWARSQIQFRDPWRKRRL